MNPLPSLRRAALALAVGGWLLLTPRLAAETSAPPAYRDTLHVTRGCLISTLAYLARFSAAHPQEQARELAVIRQGLQGEAEPHTVALVTWSGRWWLRDEYLGVLPLGLPASGDVGSERLRLRSEAALADGARSYLRLGRGLPWPEPPAEWSDGERRRELDQARALLPVPATLCLVAGGGTTRAVLFFRPGAGRVALYDPAFGTATAQTAATDDTKVIAALAGLLGYPVEGVRRAAD